MPVLRIIAIIYLLMSYSAMAQSQQSAPQQVVEQVTQQLIQLIKKTQQSHKPADEAYYQAIDQLIAPLIDFPSFTRNVMGDYGTRQYYQSLADEQAKKQFRGYYQQFIDVFKTGLIHTYGKGLLAFSGQKILVLKPDEAALKAIEQGDTVHVVQTVQGENKTHTIDYVMRPNKDGQWLLRNVIIDSVNVGSLYRQQFAASMKKYQQDFALVIAHWLDDAEQVKQQLDAKNTNDIKE